MKRIVMLILNVLLCAGILAQEQAKKKAPLKFTTEVTDYFGDTRQIWDSDQDGWEDLWCAIHRDLKHRSVYIDTDGDGVTDYDEMILWRDPFVKGPLPYKLTPEELKEQEKQNAKYRAEQLSSERERWAAFKKEIAGTLEGTKVIDKAQFKREEQEKHNALLRKAVWKFRPEWVVPQNAEGAAMLEISPLFAGGAGEGLNFTGAGQSIASIEPYIPESHTAFGNRVTNFVPAGQTDEHATGVIGSMIGNGAGTPFISAKAAKGAAPEATVQMYKSADPGVSYPTAAQEHGVSNTSNSSVGGHIGWVGTAMSDTGGPWKIWHSRPNVSKLEPNYCGLYTDMSKLVDEAMAAHSEHLSVFAAGNEGDQTAPTLQNGDSYYADDDNGVSILLPVIDGVVPGKPGANDNGFDSLPPTFSTAKNPLIVGAINPDVSICAFSTRGPTDDGRIKPDVVAKGSNIVTTKGPQGITYTEGTSFSAPMVAGGIAVMQQATQSFGVGPYRGATKKALVIHEATDLGKAGPDYTFGWGSPSFLNSVLLIKENSEKEGSPLIKETFVKPNAPVEMRVKVGIDPPPNPNPDGPQNMATFRRLKVTIAWTDPEGTVPANVRNTIDVRTPKLVNDLDLTVTPVVKEGDPQPPPFLPWVLDVEKPADPATKGVNSKDNVEQVIVDFAFGEYIIKVSPPASLHGNNQDVSIIITGIVTKKKTSTSSPPSGGSAVPSGGGLNQMFLSWNVPVGVEYALESSPDLTTWATEVEGLTTNNEKLGYIVSMAPGPSKFWRLNWQQ